MKDLNPEQMIAVKHLEGPMLVLAGAGSGKTRVVTSRIAHLLSVGVPSSEILALTFTNKAADEMRLRIKKMSDQYVLTSTFHSLGARILRESIHTLGYQSNFTIYDDRDSLDLLRNCLVAMGYKSEKGLLKSIRVAISNAKNDLLSSSDLRGDFYSQAEQILKDAFMDYQEKLKEYNALDFDDLLYLTVKLFRESKEILETYQKRWPFLLIDEYQDTNAAQYFMAKLLVGKRNNLFVVGDPDQSIYSWRGANIHNILDFEKDYESAQVITLEQNYRSSANILEAANSLIQHNKERYEKRLWSNLGAGEKIGVYIAENEKEEAFFVVKELIRKSREKRFLLKECVIFYRTNAQSRPFEDALLKYQVPYIIYGGLSFYQRREIKDILSLLRMAVSDSDYLAFTRTINLPKRGVGKATLEKLRDRANQEELPILSFVRKLLKGELSCIKLTKRAKEGLSDYLRVIDLLKEIVQAKKTLGEVVQRAIELSGYEHVLKEDPESYEDRKGNLEALINKGAEWSKERGSQTLVEFLEELSLRSSLDDHPPQDGVCLMTLHNGKGLEFALTFIVGMEEGLFPHINAKDSVGALEEERRLCYVGMTRAKQFLYLTASTYRFIWGTLKVMRPSRFLKEIPFHFLNPINQIQYEEKTSGWVDEEGFRVGTMVFHKDFGKGVVRKRYSTSMGLTYDVEFADAQTTRSLVGKYAKLKIFANAD